MKSKFKRISRSTLSVILALMMAFSTMLVGTFTVDAVYTDSHFYLIGSFTNGNWDSNQTSHPINTGYGSNGKFYIEVDVPTGTSTSDPAYFALWNGSTRYAPAEQHTEVGLTGVLGDYKHTGNSWVYTGSASKIKICIDQRNNEGDNQWYPYVWIEEVTPTQNYTVTAGTQTGGTVKVNGSTSATVSEGETVTLSAEATGNYEFEKWNTVNGITYTNANSATTTATVTGNATVTATFKEKTPVTYRLNGTPRITGKSDTVQSYDDSLPFDENNELIINYETYVDGDNYFSIVGSDGKYYDPSDHTDVTTNEDPKSTVASTTKGPNFFFRDSGTYKIKLDTSGNTPTVTVTKVTVKPADVTPTFVDGKTEYATNAIVNTPLSLDVSATLRGVSNAGQYLTYNTVLKIGDAEKVTLSNQDNSNPTFTASATGTYVLETTVTNTADTTKKVTRTTTITVTDVPTVVYKVYISDQYAIDMVESPEGSGIYVATKEFAGDPVDNDNAVFTIMKTDANGTTYAHPAAGGKYAWINSQYLSVKVDNWTDSTSSKLFKNAYSGNKIIKYNSKTDTVSTVEPTYILAKDGAQYWNDSQKRNQGTYDNGTTTVTCDNDIVTEEADSGYTYAKKYKVNSNGMVKVTTKLNEGYINNYYIPAFVVNGKSYEARTEKTGEYFAYIPVEVDSEPMEITPVYYMNACKNEGEYIRFYVNANNLTGSFDWGNTISCYSYYYKDGKSTAGGQDEADGAYPGQPMLYDDALKMYYALLPKTVNGQGISGVTINNYQLDKVHGAVSGQTVNKQSYDFNDMKYLAALQNDIIRLDMMPRGNTTSNFDIRAYTDISSIVNQFDGTTYNKWDKFTDINGDEVDIYGNKVTDTSDNVGLYIISSGSYNTSGVGQWTTNWRIYDGVSKQLVGNAVGLPSDFIPRTTTNEKGEIVPAPVEQQTSALKALYDGVTPIYEGKRVMISYENGKDIDGARRYDGRWYYSNSKNAEVNVDVKYQTSDNNGASWTAPDFDSTKAYIEYDGQRSTQVKVKVNTPITITASAPQGYIFDCFGTVDKDGKNFEPIESGNTISPELSFDMHYVARFVKAAEGTLVISHEKYAGADAKGGSGFYKVQADILDKSGNIVKTHIASGTGANGQTINDLVVNYEQAKQGYQLRITLTTITAGQNTFRSWYEATEEGIAPIGDPDEGMSWNGEPIEDPANKSGTLVFTFKKDLMNYFADNELKHSALRFYSDINPVTKDYSITYKYYDRFNQEKSYVVKDTHKDTYFTENGNSWVPNKQLIKEKAPAIDDLYKDCIWNIEKVSADGTDVTVRAQQPDKEYNVTLYNENGLAAVVSEQYKLNDFVYKDVQAKTFYTAPANKDNLAFQYWKVVNTNINSVVAKCYSLQFNLRVTCDCEITPVYATETPDEDIAFISEAQYTREQYTQNGKDYDYLYADFVVAYMEKSGINLNEVDTEKYKTGIVIEYDKNVMIAKEDEPGAKLSEADKKRIPENLTPDQIKDFVTGTSISELGLPDTRKLVEYDIDESKFNNKNRLDYFVKFKNTYNMRHYAFKAYFYVIDDQGKITVSDPVDFYLYDIGNSVERDNTTDQQSLEA